MFAKVHPAEDVKSGNTGSCHDLVRYSSYVLPSFAILLAEY